MPTGLSIKDPAAEKNGIGTSDTVPQTGVNRPNTTQQTTRLAKPNTPNTKPSGPSPANEGGGGFPAWMSTAIEALLPTIREVIELARANGAHFAVVVPNAYAEIMTTAKIAEIPYGYQVILTFPTVPVVHLPTVYEPGLVYIVN